MDEELEAIQGWLADVCNRVDGHELAGQLAILSHLVVGCELIYEYTADALVARRLDALEKSPSPPAHWANVEARLLGVDFSSPAGAFSGLLDLLLELEDDFRDALEREPELVQGATKLRPLKSGSVDLARGLVVHWARERPLVWELSEMRRRLAPKAPRRFRYRVADSLQHLAMEWQRASWPKLVPVSRFDAGGLTRRFVVNSSRNLQAGKLEILLSPGPATVYTRFSFDPDNSTFTTAESAACTSSRDRGHFLDQLMRVARQESIDVLVLPELTVDMSDRALLKDALAQGSATELLVAGSCHLAQEGELRNEAVVLGPGGETLWRHWKRGRFQVSGTELSALRGAVPAAVELPAGYEPTHSDSFVEAIQGGPTVQVMDLDLGRICVLICADAIDSSSGCPAFVEAAGVDLLIVVSMTPQSDDFMELGRRLLRAGCGLLMVNAACFVTPPARSGVTLAMAWLPYPELNFPTRIRWLAGSGKVEKLARSEWTPLAPRDGRLVRLLPDGLGLVLNLGAYWWEAFDLAK